MKPSKKKKGFAIKKGPKPPPADPLLSGGAPARFPDGTLIPNDQLPWNQLTNEELARLRKRMKKNAAWTPSITMIVRELELLGRGPNNRGSFREQWEGKDEIIIGPEEGGIGDPQKILPDETTGSRENKGIKLNRAKKRKREEEKKERALEAERLGLDPVEEEKKYLAEEERQRKEQLLKRRKKKEEEQEEEEEEEETAKVDEEDVEREAAEKTAQEEVQGERASAEAAAAAQANEEAETRAKKAEAHAKAEAEAEEAAKVSQERAEQERQEKAAKEKAAEDARISAEASAAETAAAKKSNPPESDDELSDVPDLEEPPVINTEAPPKPRNRASKRTSARPASRPPRAISATPRPKRGVANAPVPSPPPAAGMATRKRSQSITPARSAASTKASAGKKPSTAKRPAAGTRRRKRGGGGGETVDTNEEADEDLNKYCLCNEISRGTMVACENDDVSVSKDVAIMAAKLIECQCPKVWFHIGCVNLSKEEAEKEDLKWYCPICEDNTHGRRGTKRRRKN
jgi:hypothetical protein